jgi:preprotein translocase subunit SecG
MNVLLTVVLAVQMLTALGMIGLILIQHGKGADMGAAFGSGSSGSLFGASGSANFLSRTTAVLAAVFFACTLMLAYFGNLRPQESGSVLERAATTAPAAAPAPAPAASGAAAQIPGTAAPAAASTTPPPVAPAASGAGQIPVK